MHGLSFLIWLARLTARVCCVQTDQSKAFGGTSAVFGKCSLNTRRVSDSYTVQSEMARTLQKLLVTPSSSGYVMLLSNILLVFPFPIEIVDFLSDS